MKTMKNITYILFVALALSACSSTMTFQDSSVVPAASGDVKVKKDKNNNYAITVSVRNLAEPKKLSPSREVYIVWMQSDRDLVKKLGQISIGSGLFNKSLSGELTATETTQPTRVFITAENDAQTLNPSTEVVLATK
jgi:PBP1b-binding outer membrane lipoprotein LpoB